MRSRSQRNRARPTEPQTEQQTAVRPERLGGDAEWGAGYDIFPCLLVELDPYVFSITALPLEAHPALLFGLAEAQAAANNLPVRLCNGLAGIDHNLNRERRYMRSEIGISCWSRLVRNGLQLPCDMAVSAAHVAEVERFVAEKSRDVKLETALEVWTEYAKDHQVKKYAGFNEHGLPGGARRFRLRRFIGRHAPDTVLKSGCYGYNALSRPYTACEVNEAAQELTFQTMTWRW